MENPPNLILKKALKYGGIVLVFLVPLVLLVVFLAVFYNPSGIWGKPSGTTYAAGVGCELKWPKGAASDDKIIGKVIDDYIKSKRSDSPMIKEFEGKSVGLGETIAKSTRNIVNPTILVGHALNETGFATNDRAVSSKSPCYNPFGRFASSSQPQCPVGGANGKQYYKFGSYSEAIMSQGPFMGRYLNGQIATASNLEDYVKTYVGTDPADMAVYVKNLREVNAELIEMAGGALGNGICIDSLGRMINEIRLAVPAEKQRQDKDCNQVAIYMVGLYYANINGKDSSRIPFPNAAPGACSTDGLLTEELKDVGLDQKYTATRISHALPNNSDATWSTIINALTNDNPVVIETRLYRENGSNQHWITITGTSSDTRTIYYNDPATGTGRSMSINDPHWGDSGGNADSIIHAKLK